MCRGRAPEVVCGHSMGGKVVLEYLTQTVQPDALVSRPEHVWVLDSQPGRVRDNVATDVDRVLRAVQVRAAVPWLTHEPAVA